MNLRAQVFNIWYRNFLQFKRSWLIAFFWILFEPLVVLLAIGYGVGSYINNMSGVSYIDFFFPGLLCSTSMIIAFFESTYGNFSKLTYQQIYRTMILSPISSQEIVLGEILWAASKATLSSFGIFLIGIPLGLKYSLFFLPAFIFIFLSALVFAAFGMLITSIVKNYDSIIYPTSGVIVPMALLCGTYYPIESLPLVIKPVIYLLPLTHSVEAVRGLLLHGFNWMQIINFIFLFILLIVFVKQSIPRINKRLIN